MKYYIAFIIMSIAAFILFAVDKVRAIRGRWRITEKALLLVAFLGGGPGALLGMLAFRHKTRHLQFKLLIPAAIILQLILGGVIQINF